MPCQNRHSSALARGLVSSVCLVALGTVLSPALGAARTPQELVQNLAETLQNGDKTRAAALVDRSTPLGNQVAEMFGLFAEIAAAQIEFEQAITDKFGMDSLDEIMSMMDAESPLTGVQKQLDQAQIHVSGNTATVVIPGDEGEPLPLVKKGGQWFINASAMATDIGGAEALRFVGSILRPMAQLMVEGKKWVESSSDLEQFNSTSQSRGEKIMAPTAESMMQMFAQAMQEGFTGAVEVRAEGPAGNMSFASPPADAEQAVQPDKPFQARQANQPSAVDESTKAQIASWWEDFNHYVLIARPDLAAGFGQQLLNKADNEVLLDVVEASRFRDPSRTFIRASKIETVADVARQLEARIQAARIARSRDPDRIKADIRLLAEGQRPYRNAVERLRAAGQYAAPYLLASLEGEDQSALHPYVMQAMVAVGRPLVYPLAQALPDLEAVAMQRVAEVLAEIGYPLPMANLKQILERADLPPSARRVVEVAYRQLLDRSNLPGDLSAAELFLLLGNTQYSSASHPHDLPGYDPSEGKGLVWHYSPRTGLVPIHVPGEIYGDVLAMRFAVRALQLEPDLDQALSLFLMANLRRENRLPDGQVDPSYTAQMQPPLFYGMLAGPLRLHDVLGRALRDADPELSLDAIEALASTAGTDALVNRGAAKQPLVRVLSYPDRRVRFWGAVTMAGARPRETFSGAHRVVPVLAEAVRQSGKRYALVLADSEHQLNELLATAHELGYEAFGGASLAEAMEQVRARPAVDLIVVSLNATSISHLLRDTAHDYQLGAVPIVAIASPQQLLRLNEVFADEKRLAAVAMLESEELGTVIEQTLARYGGPPIGPEEGTHMALKALALLKEMALGSEVYRVTDSQPALMVALKDERDQVITEAGAVLARIGNAEAQDSLANAALSTFGAVQVSLLESLAESATHFGLLIEPHRTDRLLELVHTASGDTAIAAAQAHGALTLPTSNAVKLIIR